MTSPPEPPSRGRPPLRPAPVKVRGILGPPAPEDAPKRSRGIRPVAPTAKPEPLDPVARAPRRPPPGEDGG